MGQVININTAVQKRSLRLFLSYDDLYKICVDHYDIREVMRTFLVLYVNDIRKYFGLTLDDMDEFGPSNYWIEDLGAELGVKYSEDGIGLEIRLPHHIRR